MADVIPFKAQTKPEPLAANEADVRFGDRIIRVRAGWALFASIERLTERSLVKLALGWAEGEVRLVDVTHVMFAILELEDRGVRPDMALGQIGETLLAQPGGFLGVAKVIAPLFIDALCGPKAGPPTSPGA